MRPISAWPSTLHHSMHQLPNFPDHSKRLRHTEARGSAPATVRRRGHAPLRHHTPRQPRVLVAWQRLIARQLGQPLP
jgi:hypothetical protein